MQASSSYRLGCNSTICMLLYAHFTVSICDCDEDADASRNQPKLAAEGDNWHARCALVADPSTTFGCILGLVLVMSMSFSSRAAL